MTIGNKPHTVEPERPGMFLIPYFPDDYKIVGLTIHVYTRTFTSFTGIKILYAVLT